VIPLKIKVSYATSSCSIKTKKSAKQIPGKTSVTIGVKIGGKKDAVISKLEVIFTKLINLN